MSDVSSPTVSEGQPESDDVGSPRWLHWIDLFSKTLATIASVTTILMMLNVISDVIGRSFFNRPVAGTLEVTQYAWMPSLVSLALGYALLRGEHLRVSLLTGPTGPRTQRVIEVVGMSFGLVVVGFFIWFGVEKLMESITIGERPVVAQWIMIWPFRALLVVGLAGLLLQTVAQLIRALTVKEFVSADEDEAIEMLSKEAGLLDEIVEDVQTVKVGDRR